MTDVSKKSKEYDIDVAIREVISIWDAAEDVFDWGGGENEDGVLTNGCPDFECGKQQTIAVLRKLVRGEE